jgi:uncharacterized membrane protein
MQLKRPGSLEMNVSDRERMASITIGSSLLVNALLTGRRFRLMKGIAGAALLVRGALGYCPVYARALHRSRSTRNGLSAINLKTRVTVNKDRQEIYHFWRRLENLPYVLKHIESITTIDDIHSKWKLKMPAHIADIQWTAEIVKDEPGKLIGWQSVNDSIIHSAGKVEFSDAGDGYTTIDVLITYHPPLGAIGDSVARFFSPSIEKIIQDDIKNFVYIAEHTEVYPV